MWLLIERPYDDDDGEYEQRIDEYASLKEALVEAKIPVAETEISEPKEVFGLVFPEEGKDLAIEKLKARIVEQETDVPGVFLGKQIPFVRREGIALQAWSELRPVFIEFAIRLGIEIIVTNPHGDNNSPDWVNENELRVKFYSSSRDTQEKRYQEVFSFPMEDGQEDGMEPSFEGMPIFDDQEIVAELIEKNLYILFDLPHSENHAADVLRLIMERYAQYIEDPAGYFDLIKSNSCQAYINECGKRMIEIVNSKRESIKSAEEEIVYCQKRIVEAIRNKAIREKELQGLLTDRNLEKNEFAQEFEKLCAIPDIEMVIISKGRIQVFTVPITVEYEGRFYLIGKFRIDICSEEGRVKIYNITNKRGSYDHPHIHDGDCCFGNIDDSVAKLIGQYQYFVLVQILLKYLKSVNEGGWYTKVNHWPEVNSEGKEEDDNDK